MTRKEFIKMCGVLGIAIPIQFSLTSCEKENITIESFNGKKVIIIGAGISGLAAANKLKQEGFVVTILEAQERVGGRIRTNRSLGIPFDEGASWIHGPTGNPITEIASQAGANTFLTDDDSVEVFNVTGTPYTDSILTDEETQFDAAIQNVLNAGSQTQSFETVFNSLYPTQANDRLWKYMLSAFLEFSIGGDIAKLSSKYFFDDETFNGNDQIITNGYDKITDYLAEGLDIRINKRVSNIDYSNETLQVTTQQGNIYESDYVLVTVPLGVLKTENIQFSPTLPASKSAAIDNTQMGNVNKFLLVWDTVFWDPNLQYIGYTPEEKGKFNYFLNVNKFANTNALMTFAFGEYATTTESMSDADVINKIMLHLKSIYGNAIPNPTSMLRTKWGQNENAYGAYSFATNGTTSLDFDTMAASVNNRLFFAGEHTSREYRGTVHGGYLSGLREAGKIMDL
jgi:monoamine oxidase